ncbi:hypothetical protein SKAU_G00039880 [Synaphobranchus kaupii]|uniref:Uncharacterized protein n=1 Tax=Synaphobranchus kaupii TaxID=118154 RepID=A0A9Q1GFI6_SYNKA|nr:hypothetical protein SKAU_G00039880 [Synaphobranchus kaupii]
MTSGRKLSCTSVAGGEETKRQPGYRRFPGASRDAPEPRGDRLPFPDTGAGGELSISPATEEKSKMLLEM